MLCFHSSMILTPIHKVATHHIITASKAVCGHFLDLNGIQRWRVLLSVLTITLLCAPSIWADPYEVLVVDIAGAIMLSESKNIKKMPTSLMRSTSGDILPPDRILMCYKWLTERSILYLAFGMKCRAFIGATIPAQ